MKWDEFPPETGLIKLEYKFPPVSAQSSAEKKSQLRDGVRNLMHDCPFVLGSDVKVHIEWEIHETQRYESDSSADVDNIIKPIIDALAGPNGIIINDCQVQEVTCHWHNPYSMNVTEQFSVEIAFDPESFYDKSNLLFIQFENALCFPIIDNADEKAISIVVDLVSNTLASRKQLLEMGTPEYEARGIMPIQRFFHRTRISGFRVKALEEIKGSA
jgi:Holliday junction resolvase RusA-like endonuclease